MLVGVAFADPQQFDCPLRTVARGFGGTHDHRRTAVGHQAAVEHAQRRGDDLGLAHVVHGDRLLHVRLRVQRGVGALVHRHRGEVVTVEPTFVEINLCGHREGRRHTHAVGLLVLWMADVGQRRLHLVAHAGETVVAGDAQHMTADAGLHQRRGMAHQQAAGHAAHRDGGVDLRAQPDVFAQHAAQHQLRRGERVGGEQSVDVRHLQAGVGQRAQAGFGVQRHAGAVGQRADLGVVHAADDGFVSHDFLPGYARLMRTSRCRR